MDRQPSCRDCFLEAMEPKQRARYLQDEHPDPTTCTYYCPRHQADQDAAMAMLDSVLSGDPLSFGFWP